MKSSSILAGILYGFVSMVLIPILLVSLNNSFHFISFLYVFTQLVGGIFILGGGLLLVYSTKLFARHGKGGSPLPFDPPNILVTVGVYTYVRNPMFTASALIWFGEFLLFGSILLFPYAVGWVLFNHIYLIAQDEKCLEKRFGKKYVKYKKNTPRYIPRFIY